MYCSLIICVCIFGLDISTVASDDYMITYIGYYNTYILLYMELHVHEHII